MNGYLRDFINDNVGQECGGGASITNPNTLQKQVNELKTRVDQLEGGVGLTVTIQDQITISLSQKEDTWIGAVPTNGTLTMLSYVASEAGETSGLETLKLIVRRSSGDVENSYAISHTSRSGTSVISVPVYVGDWLEVTSTPYSYIDTSTGGTIITTTTLDAVLIVLQLPPSTYGVSDAGS